MIYGRKATAVYKKSVWHFTHRYFRRKNIWFGTVLKFGIVGISNTMISYGLNILVLLAMRPLDVIWDFIVGNIISFVLSVLWSFYWNNRFVFILRDGEKRDIGKTLLRTYLSYGFTGIILNNMLSWLWISVLDISKYVAPLINLVISVPLNFVINKFWAFKTKT